LIVFNSSVAFVIKSPPTGETSMTDKKQSHQKKVAFEFIVDIFKWLLEINFHRYGKKKAQL
jgi:hypothetical protein